MNSDFELQTFLFSDRSGSADFEILDYLVKMKYHLKTCKCKCYKAWIVAYDLCFKRRDNLRFTINKFVTVSSGDIAQW
jgi:hypothetical protein